MLPNMLGIADLFKFTEEILNGKLHFFGQCKSKFLKQIIVGKKSKVRISERMLQESKARKIFRKTNISYLLIQCAYQGVRNVCFSENLACFVSF